jgi:hypothetical protein
VEEYRWWVGVEGDYVVEVNDEFVSFFLSRYHVGFFLLHE